MTNSELRINLYEARRQYRIAGSGQRSQKWKELKLAMLNTLKAEIDRKAN